MTPDPDDAGPDLPERLVVAGAAAGMGRWLIDHLLAARPWAEVVLVDTAAAAPNLAQAAAAFAAPVTQVLVGADAPPSPDEAPAATTVDRVLLAVPATALPDVVAVLAPRLAPIAALGIVSATQARALAAARHAAPDRVAYGLHLLFDTSARSLDGQTVALVCDDAGGEQAARWLHDLVLEGGGIVEQLDAGAHDESMAYVQTMAHQALLAFSTALAHADVPLEVLWERRTPLFEALFGLATRMLAEGRHATVTEIQTGGAGERAGAELAAALERVRDAVAAGGPQALDALLAADRDRFTGSLFETVQATAVSTVTASQSKRAQLGEVRRAGELVGIHPVARPEALRVGRISDVSPTTVTLTEVMTGRKGQATLLEGPGAANSRRVGNSGKPKDTVFGLGHIELVRGDELERHLDGWLAWITRDVRFLVPESVAGAGVLAIISGHEAVRRAELLSEVVRTGQRAVVLRLWIRADHDVDDAVEELRERVQAAYAWPTGVALTAPHVERVHFLGPAGTFSEVAAHQALATVGAPEAQVVAHESFPAVLAAIDERSLGILPISSSASGLVTRSTTALLEHPGEVQAGGVVDVAVRFDAYVPAGEQLTDLRGAPVYSHPQALQQCSRFIRRWQLEPVPCPSTTDGLGRVAAEGGAVGLAAAGIVLDGVGELKVAEREVDDLSGSITRFLVVGRAGAFGALEGGSEPTLRSICVGRSPAAVAELIGAGGPAFDEVLSADGGLCLWVTSRVLELGSTGEARHLGRAPWSPRTPVVRVEVVL